MLEPSGFGAAVCFGPNTRNFRDVVQLLREADAVEVVHNADELSSFLRRCLESDGYRRELGRRAQQVVRQQQGSTARTMELVAEHVIDPQGEIDTQGERETGRERESDTLTPRPHGFAASK